MKLRIKPNILRSILSIVLLLVIAILVLLFLREHPIKFNNLLNVSFFYIVILILLTITNMGINGYGMNLILFTLYDIKLTMKEWFGLASITSFGNYITPFRGGASARAVYLKKRHKLPYTSSVTTFAVTHITLFLVAGILGIFTNIAAYLIYNIFNIGILMLFILIFVVSLMIILFSPTLPKTRYKFINYFVRVINEWKEFSSRKRLILKIGILNLFFVLFSTLRIYLIFLALGNTFPLILCLYIALLSFLADLLAITPANLGVREAVIVFSSKLVGANLTLGVYVAAINRAISIIVVFVFGFIFSWILARKR